MRQSLWCLLALGLLVAGRGRAHSLAEHYVDAASIVPLVVLWLVMVATDLQGNRALSNRSGQNDGA